MLPVIFWWRRIILRHIVVLRGIVILWNITIMRNEINLRQKVVSWNYSNGIIHEKRNGLAIWRKIIILNPIVVIGLWTVTLINNDS